MGYGCDVLVRLREDKGRMKVFKEFSSANFVNFNELKQVYGNASLIANHRIIFNIKGNDYRLIVSINFRTQAGYPLFYLAREK
ncbi:type II toxin-antitoxin system HigB family toxin [Pedobacter sp.]|uniref:type II toxin-antitoxin system HigB family toxin n=1 Tax=Pedobacter sp. TaxID=1411316 RepID=UPI002D1FAF67|nr:type II toxin-antitoxin system HigB family toxin [Pedobacter sp.]